jgi:hypothetical protein
MFETVISVKDKYHICTPTIIEYLKNLNIEPHEDHFIHIAYAIKEESLLVFYIKFLNNVKELSEESFTNCLTKLNTSNFDELLFLSTYYGVFLNNEDNLFAVIKSYNQPKNTLAYFKNTFGKLLYHYQLEQLYCSLTNSSIQVAIDFRKSINLKRQVAFEKAKSIKLPTQDSLYDVIKKHQHFGFTLYPKLKECITLYEYLNET